MFSWFLHADFSIQLVSSHLKTLSNFTKPFIMICVTSNTFWPKFFFFKFDLVCLKSYVLIQNFSLTNLSFFKLLIKPTLPTSLKYHIDHRISLVFLWSGLFSNLTTWVLFGQFQTNLVDFTIIVLDQFEPSRLSCWGFLHEDVLRALMVRYKSHI